VNRVIAIQQLPELHAVAIRLSDEDCGDHVIAVALGIGADEVATLLHIARTKLANLMTSDAVRSAQT
jgi:DNA-directed RNA polymerase specialized sigma24 family protein